MKQKIITREFLKKAFVVAALVVVSPSSPAAENSAPNIIVQDSRTLSFKIAEKVGPDRKIVYYDDDIHTVTYYENGAYNQDALTEINELLRDREQNGSAARIMDRNLIDLLYEIKTREERSHQGLDVVFHVICGYRTRETNERLRTNRRNPYRPGVAKDSLHIYAKAIDIFVPEIAGEELRDTAFCIGKGGVGWYPKFEDMFPFKYIHVDSGRVHHWGFNPQTIRCPEVH